MEELQTELHASKQNYASLRQQNLGLQKRAVAKELCGEVRRCRLTVTDPH
jgi:ribosomal protein L29